MPWCSELPRITLTTQNRQKVFKGITNSEAIYNDIAQVLQKFQGSNATVILDSIGITDTTGNMGKLGQYCRENGRRHGYWTDHNFHCNAILAFNGEIDAIVFVISAHVISYIVIDMSIYLQAKHIPLAASAMSKMHSIIGYFDKSTQALTN